MGRGYKGSASGPARLPWWVLCDAYRVAGRVFAYECGGRVLDSVGNELPRGLARPPSRDVVYRGSLLAEVAGRAVAVAYAGWDGSGHHYVDVAGPGTLTRYLVPAWGRGPALPAPGDTVGALREHGGLLVFEPLDPGGEALVLAPGGVPADAALRALRDLLGELAGPILSPVGVRSYVYGWRVVANTFRGALYRVLAPGEMLGKVLRALEAHEGIRR